MLCNFGVYFGHFDYCYEILGPVEISWGMSIFWGIGGGGVGRPLLSFRLQVLSCLLWPVVLILV